MRRKSDKNGALKNAVGMGLSGRTRSVRTAGPAIPGALPLSSARRERPQGPGVIGHGLMVHATADELASADAGNQTGLGKDLHVVRHGSRGDAMESHQLAAVHFRMMADILEDEEPRLIGEGF